MSDQAEAAMLPSRPKGAHHPPDVEYLKSIGLMPLSRAAQIAGMHELWFRQAIAGKVTIRKIARRPFVKIDEFNGWLTGENTSPKGRRRG